MPTLAQRVPVPDSPQHSSIAGESEHPEELMTLHAYSNLIQMPVLILGPGGEPVPSIKSEKFSISLDSGPLYHPTHVRVEGSDPISLSILIDLSGSAADLVRGLDEAIAKLAPNGLTQHDHVSIFAIDCSLIQTLNDQPADPGILLASTGRALTGWTMRHAQKHHPPCTETVHLFDALVYLSAHLAPLPGRRMVLALTDGVDRGSKHTWYDVVESMQQSAVAAIGLRPQVDVAAPPRINSPRALSFAAPEDPFNMLCELSGGVLLEVNHWSLARQLQRFPTLVRGRYILEFPRPWNSTGGHHTIVVSLGKGASSNYIRATGTSVPLPDPKILADPNTLQNDPTLTPEMGKRKVLNTPH